MKRYAENDRRATEYKISVKIPDTAGITNVPGKLNQVHKDIDSRLNNVEVITDNLDGYVPTVDLQDAYDNGNGTISLDRDKPFNVLDEDGDGLSVDGYGAVSINGTNPQLNFVDSSTSNIKLSTEDNLYKFNGPDGYANIICDDLYVSGSSIHFRDASDIWSSYSKLTYNSTTNLYDFIRSDGSTRSKLKAQTLQLTDNIGISEIVYSGTYNTYGFKIPSGNYSEIIARTYRLNGTDQDIHFYSSATHQGRIYYDSSGPSDVFKFIDQIGNFRNIGVNNVKIYQGSDHGNITYNSTDKLFKFYDSDAGDCFDGYVSIICDDLYVSGSSIHFRDASDIWLSYASLSYDSSKNVFGLYSSALGYYSNLSSGDISIYYTTDYPNLNFIVSGPNSGRINYDSSNVFNFENSAGTLNRDIRISDLLLQGDTVRFEAEDLEISKVATHDNILGFRKVSSGNFDNIIVSGVRLTAGGTDSSVNFFGQTGEDAISCMTEDRDGYVDFASRNVYLNSNVDPTIYFRSSDGSCYSRLIFDTSENHFVFRDCAGGEFEPYEDICTGNIICRGEYRVGGAVDSLQSKIKDDTTISSELNNAFGFDTEDGYGRMVCFGDSDKAATNLTSRFTNNIRISGFANIDADPLHIYYPPAIVAQLEVSWLGFLTNQDNLSTTYMPSEAALTYLNDSDKSVISIISDEERSSRNVDDGYGYTRRSYTDTIAVRSGLSNLSTHRFANADTIMMALENSEYVVEGHLISVSADMTCELTTDSDPAKVIGVATNSVTTVGDHVNIAVDGIVMVMTDPAKDNPKPGYFLVPSNTVGQKGLAMPVQDPTGYLGQIVAKILKNGTAGQRIQALMWRG